MLSFDRRGCCVVRGLFGNWCVQSLDMCGLGSCGGRDCAGRELPGRGLGLRPTTHLPRHCPKPNSRAGIGVQTRPEKHFWGLPPDICFCALFWGFGPEDWFSGLVISCPWVLVIRLPRSSILTRATRNLETPLGNHLLRYRHIRGGYALGPPSSERIMSH